jgi:hypothetical protein
MIVIAQFRSPNWPGSSRQICRRSQQSRVTKFSCTKLEHFSNQKKMFLLFKFFYFIGFFFLSLECFSNWKKMLLYLRQALLFLFLNFGHPALLRAPTNLSALSWQKLTKNWANEHFFLQKMAILIHDTVIYAEKYDHYFGFQEIFFCQKWLK